MFVDGAENQVLNYLSRYFNDSTVQFSEKLRQKVSSVIPLVINYNEIQGKNEKGASPQLLSGVLLYKITGNETYLHYAKETAEWLNQSGNREFLLFWYNVSNGGRASISTNGFEAHLYALIALVEQDNRFLPLANWALNEFHRIFVPATNLSYVSVRSDETPDISFADLGNQAYRIALFSYAYAITKNVTYKQWAKDLTSAFWDRKSAINITPAYLNQNGSVLYDYVKEDQHAGFFLLGLESAYYYTKDHYYREIIESYAKAVSTYFWHSTTRRFMYRIQWETGAVTWYGSVHGFSLLDLGLVNAYLLTGNRIFLERARSDYDELIVKGYILKNGLIVHAINNNNQVINPESNWGWNKFAFPAGYAFYVLTRNETYLNALNTLYAALRHHWKTHGYVASIDSNTFSPLGSSILLSEYVHVLNAMLYVDRELHGGAFTGNTFDYLFREVGAIQYCNPQEKFGMGYFRLKGIPAGNHSWNVIVFDAEGNIIESVEMEFSVPSLMAGGIRGGGIKKLV
ncbi:MAG: hypothetical protein ACQXXH_02895 [Candidatus Bathyarchaeia archaeon]|nr:hypothetical protein [Candidatus Bathyarchaeota archaeon A05DMB-4]MDH7594691.1 hypothetical protein [Candidatus Bathyarchaeota archaeon]